MKNQFTMSEIMNYELSGLPKSRRGMDKYADRNDWSFIEVPSTGKGGMRREYVLPDELFELIDQLIGAMKKVQSQSTSCPTSISQVAAEAAISGDQSVLEPMVAAFEKRCDLVVDGLNAIKGITCLRPDGAFYVYPDIKPLIKAAGLSSCTEFSAWLLEKVGVAVVPGDAFGLGGYMRISYATDEATLKDALSRIEKAVADLDVAE